MLKKEEKHTIRNNYLSIKNLNIVDIKSFITKHLKTFQ